LPGQDPHRDTVLEHAELITAVDLPPLGFSSRSRYRKVRERASYAFALVSVAAALDVRDGVVRDVRIALGGVAHKPWRAEKAEEALRGRLAGEESFRAAADAELADATPLHDNAYKVPLARNVMTRTLLQLSEER
jgi:xanthine dehydrogenase YagS FAD-binding subunit